MIHTSILTLFFLGLFLPGPATGSFMGVDSSRRRSSCNGSLHLFLPNSSRISYVRSGELNKVRNIDTTRVWKVGVEGCGCVLIYSEKAGRGKSCFLRPPRSLQDGDKQFFKVVKSLKIVNCTNTANLFQVVVGSVVVAALLVCLCGIIFIRRWRRFGRTEAAPVEVTDVEEIADCSKQDPDGQSVQQSQPDRVNETEM